jgi:cell division protein FtsQ
MDADAYPQEILAEEEPKYLRRQKPLEIKRRKFGRKAWRTYIDIALWGALGLAACGAAYALGHFLLASPEMALIHPEQVSIAGNRYADRASILEVFAPDRGRSVLRIPLAERKRDIEAIPWVEQAVVRRSLPNRIQVEIVERTPVAFLRNGSDLALLDGHGVILEGPIAGDFHFPVVTGIDSSMSVDNRERRMQLFAGFTQQIQSAHAGALEAISEVDLADDHDVRATITGLSGAFDGASTDAGIRLDAPVLVHFGDGDFAAKYQTLIENVGQWRATTGHIQSIDLRFNGEAVVNADTPAPLAVKPPAPAKAAKAVATASTASKLVASSKAGRPIAKAPAKSASAHNAHRKKHSSHPA